jgi:preprotein translocase subunit SecA
MNVQRQVIYAQRREVLEGKDMSEDVLDWIDEVIGRTVGAYTDAEYAEEWDLDELVNQLHALYGTDITLDELREDGVDLADREALIGEFQEDAREVYGEKQESFGLNPDTNAPLIRDVERYVILQIVDRRWREHLENMEYLREGIHLRSMAQKDPLTEYRHEGHVMFEELGQNIREEVVLTLFHAELAPEARQEVTAPQADGAGNGDLRYEHETAQGADAIAAAGAAPQTASSGTSTSVGGGGGTVATAAKTAVGPNGEKLGRNDPCWCGSGKKFKKCHGA